MQLIAAVISFFVPDGQHDPSPSPRPGTKALIDNAPVSGVGRLVATGQPSPLHRHLYGMMPAGTVHADEPIGAAAKATIFELT